MDFKAWLIEALGLDTDAADDAIVAALKKKMEPGETVDVPAALQSALSPIATLVGVADGADAAAVLAGVQKLKGGSDSTVVALQAELKTVTTSLNAVQQDRAKDKATAFVDGAILLGRVGVKPMRDEYIAMHMKDPVQAEKLIGAMPVLEAGTVFTRESTSQEGSNDNPALLAQKAGAYQRKMADAGVQVSIATAVRAVHEGKAA